MPITGYQHASYAASLIEYGELVFLEHSGGWLLKRAIPGYSSYDAMGCYPLFSCSDWSALDRDMSNLGESLVSVTIVTDPFGDFDTGLLSRCFPDIVNPFKEHFVVDLGQPVEKVASSHHRRNARKALSNVMIENSLEPASWIEDWIELYANLIRRHDIKGMAAFSDTQLSEQLGVPGIVAFRGTNGGQVMGMQLWYVQGDVAYYHLGAYSARGYDLRASFALFWHAIDYFSTSGLQWLNLGAGAGISRDSSDGLSRFKRGWATGTRTAYLCGRVFERQRYRTITTAGGISSTGYFPAYREGEFI
ncbi:MAG: GNAT family N-acetyltransferase [Anaerolineaceae bacterium]|nr:MAG: GNAT family N-acetyltransferase [Anaerolineaceae bacterium]